MVQWLEEPEGRLFSEWLEGRKIAYEVVQRTSKDVVDLYRAQGALEVIDCLANLADNLKQFNRDVHDKKADPAKAVDGPHVKRESVLGGITNEIAKQRQAAQ